MTGTKPEQQGCDNVFSYFPQVLEIPAFINNSKHQLSIQL